MRRPLSSKAIKHGRNRLVEGQVGQIRLRPTLDHSPALLPFTGRHQSPRETAMEYRLLGRSGLKISTITMGTMTIGGEDVFARVGDVSVEDAKRYVDMCLDAGV